jgi:hypothetical protein
MPRQTGEKKMNKPAKMIVSKNFDLAEMRGALVEVVSGPCRDGLLQVRPIGRKFSEATKKHVLGLKGGDVFEILESEVERFV